MTVDYTRVIFPLNKVAAGSNFLLLFGEFITVEKAENIKFKEAK
jgi:hypothetical protein